MGNDSAGFSAKLLDIDNGRTIIIDNARNANELDSVLRLVGVIFPPQPDGESKYTHEFWAQRLGERPELLLRQGWRRRLRIGVRMGRGQRVGDYCSLLR